VTIARAKPAARAAVSLSEADAWRQGGGQREKRWAWRICKDV